jgi:hypothetical protein
LGNRLRAKLIEKWYTLGREHSGSERETLIQIREAENLVTTVMGKSLVPQYPLFVLTILQHRESSQAANSVSGAYGYHFQVLITTALDKALRELPRTITRDLPMDLLQTVLPLIAFRLFKLRKKSLSEADFEDVVSEYQQRHAVRFNVEHLKEILIAAHMIERNIEGQYRFKYAYIGYYFVASYIANNLDSETHGQEMRELLDRMTSSLYIEDYANVLTFFMYFRRDNRTIRNIVDLARSLFAEHKPCELDTQLPFVKKLKGDNDPLQLESGNVRQHQEEHKRELDEDDRARLRDQVPDDDDQEAAKWRRMEQTALARQREEKEDRAEEDSILNLAQQFNLAAKTVHLMGQILRNFPGALESSPKIEIATQCELLGLRSLQALYSVVSKRLDDFRWWISEKLIEDGFKEPTNELEQQELKDRTDNFLSNALMFSAYIYVRRISHAVGSEHLKETYRAIDRRKVELECPTSIELIHTSVKLDHFREFASQEILDFYEDLEKNPFASWILRRLVRDHFYLYPVSFEVREKVCKKLNIIFNDVKAFGSSQKMK